MNEFQRWLMVAVEPTSMASLRATPPQNQGPFGPSLDPGHISISSLFNITLFQAVGSRSFRPCLPAVSLDSFHRPAVVPVA